MDYAERRHRVGFSDKSRADIDEEAWDRRVRKWILRYYFRPFGYGDDVLWNFRPYDDFSHHRP